MLFLRLLAIIIGVLHAWLLHTAKSDHMQRYKRTLAQGADRFQAATGQEQCGTVSQKHPARSVGQHYILAGLAGRYTRLTDLWHRMALTERSCAGGCASEGGIASGLPDRLLREKHSQKGQSDTWPDRPSRWKGRQSTRSKHDEALDIPHPDAPGESSTAVRETGTVGRPFEGQSNVTGISAPPPRRGESHGSEGSVASRRIRRSPQDSGGMGGDPERSSATSTHPASSSEGDEADSGEPEGQAWGADRQDAPLQWMTALYFSGQGERLRLNPATFVELPHAAFTAELWVKLEGGQDNPAIIAGVFDNCSHPPSERGWSIGVRTLEPSGRKDGRVYFSLRTDRALKSSTLMGQWHYQPGAWSHVVARYDGHRMALFVDGSKVGEGGQQAGDLNRPSLQGCRVFLLGGGVSGAARGFRGHLGGVVLWNHARDQEELFQRHAPRAELQRPLLALWADFSHADRLLTAYKERRRPSVSTLPAPESELVSPFLPPACGLTVCDNPDVVLSYDQHWQLRANKRVRYRVVNVGADDGGRPAVSGPQIRRQHRALAEAFGRYNLTLELSVLNVCNSSLQRRFVLSSCSVARVGNRHCDPECDHPLTGRDGGDCTRLGPCYNWMRGDGSCDAACNGIRYDYDDGDCCDPDVTDVTRTCFDPESPDRAYLSVKELKELLHLSSSDTLNVFFASSAREELAGAATWPWAKEALTHQGGMIMNPSYFGTLGHNNTMIHELGHIFGLYHVFKGVTERESCDDPCQETIASMETGDFCADTAPTPKSKACRDPDPVNDTCGLARYHDTPYSNYMSYTDDNCTDHFTPNQVARMHCYIDLVYKNWVHGRRPAPVPLAPIVIGHDEDSVSFHWLHPVSGPLMQREEGVNCQLCDVHGVLHQYASEASSPHVCDTSGYWSPEEAVGPPDVFLPCEPSMRTWSPEFSLFEANVSTPCPPSEGCVLQLHFQHPVVPDTLTVWITYISTSEPVSTLEFILESGESVSAGSFHSFCDIPLTVQAGISARVKGVKIRTFDRKLEVDAVLLTSRPSELLCSGCRPLLYRVVRKPPIREVWGPIVLTGTTFTDSDVRRGELYEYHIQVEAEGLLSELSPPLIYTHGQSYCGDSLLDEECDDGNLLDGDGCSKRCRVEPRFNCVGEPSRCYVFEGDDVHEDFERTSSAPDCGVFTPQGFVDQWASSASGSHQDQRCPAHTATGEPDLTRYVELNDALFGAAWVPCSAPSSAGGPQEPVWLRVGFETPGVAVAVLIFLTHDGGPHVETCRKKVSVQLCDTMGENHTLGTYELSCHRNPLVVNVTHNLSRPFFKTAWVQLGFLSPHVAVLGVALRTFCNFSAFALTGCAEGGMASCRAVNVDHASVDCKPSQEPMHCSVTCRRGYTLSVLSGPAIRPRQSKTELECVNGTWDRVVSCQPVDCGLPDQSQVFFASFSCPWGTTFGKRCTFTCNAPAVLQGESDALVCLNDGLWSFPEAYCKIECPGPPAVPNASLVMPQCEGSRHDVGTVCRYRCNPGYYVAGTISKRTRKKLLRLECLEGGVWQNGSCSPVSCPALPPMFQGMYTCTNHLDFDSVCTLQCPDPTERSTIRCTKDGSWTEDFSMCEKIEGACPTLGELNQVEHTCDEGSDVGAVCYPTCTVPLSDPVVLATNSTAETLKHWVLPTRVQSIVCTGTMRWHPNPENIHCIQACEPFGGDGWCDSINNRAYCQYDGGDCCPSTLLTGKVVHIDLCCCV
uniref:Sushi domain-containing protein n=1 Tax=Electrophorus electricus TaxID=8005 RepID=A0A4W4EG09_ELEEL